MKKFSVMFFALILALFCISCGSTTADDDGDDADTVYTGSETGDTTPGDDTGDTTPGGDTDADTDNPDPTSDPSDPTGEPTDQETANGIITKIQKGEVQEGTDVTTECVVTAIFYAEDDDHNHTAIKGLYVSELVKKAQPYSGIYVFIKATAAVDEYAVGDKLEVKGVYKE